MYYIDNIYYSEEAGDASIFQKCSEKDIDLPCFCYHESLSIAGNCRMCVVEINTSIKLVVSCAIPMQNNIKILTNNQRIIKARENIIEFLLVNHPLDCPICDQGGECDLQDITLVYGSDKSRFYEYNKRAVLDKECGPFIKMIMTRCIHCTRCIRFLTEIDNDYKLGIVNRGNNSEISGFVKTNLISELSGNVIDLCPVGALTSRPFSFVARSWELNYLESIDILDSIASSIRIDYFNNKIYRILPIYDSNLNEDWITNKIRFIYDSQHIQRLFFPLIKINENFINIDWLTSFNIFIYKLLKYSFNNNLYSFFGNFSDLIGINYMDNFFNSLGIEIKLISNIKINIDFRFNYLINNYLIDLNSISNIIILGLNLRVELPLLNVKLKKIISKNKINIFYNLDNNYNFKNDLINFKKILSFKKKINLNLLFSKIQFSLFNNKFFFSLCFLFGLNFFFNKNFKFLNYLYNKFNNYFFNFQIYTIISNLSYINFLEYGKNLYNNKLNLENSLIFINNIDDEIFLKNLINKNNFLIYNGSFFDNGVKVSNLIFPIYMFFEYNGFFFNIYKNLRKITKVINPDIFLYSLNELFYSLNYFLNSKSINFTYFLFNFNKIKKFFINLNLNWSLEIAAYLKLKNYDNIFKNIYYINIFKIDIINNLMKSLTFNFYKNDVIAKNSKNLHLASINYLENLSILEKKYYCEKKEFKNKYYLSEEELKEVEEKMTPEENAYITIQLVDYFSKGQLPEIYQAEYNELKKIANEYEKKFFNKYNNEKKELDVKNNESLDNTVELKKDEKKFYTETYINNILLMKIFQSLHNINFKLNPIINRWFNAPINRRYSSSSGFKSYEISKILDSEDPALLEFLDKNLTHLQLLECKPIGDSFHIIAFQYTSNPNPVKFLNGKKIPVFQIEEGKSTYMSYQGIEFIISKDLFDNILKNRNINIEQKILAKTPDLINEYIDKGLISVLNIQTLEEKIFREFNLTPYKYIEEFKNELLKPIKKD